MGNKCSPNRNQSPPTPTGLDRQSLCIVIQPPKQDLLAGLRKWTLERDDESDPAGRIYRDPDGNIYHSITRVLGATAPAEQKERLNKWLERPGSIQERDSAAKRGTFAHDNAEYVLKTGRKLAIHAANKRGLWKPGDDGLERAPRALTRWAIEKAIQGSPKVNWSAAGYARGLRSFILERVTAIHACEFSVYSPAMSVAGTCDALVDIDGKLTICDWKTSARERSEEMLLNYKHQLGAYSHSLRGMTGIQPEAGAIVVARRSGAPQVRILDALELAEAEARFSERAADYWLNLAA